MATGQEIVDEVRIQLNDNDASNLRWSDAELLDYINASAREIVTLFPEANVVEELVSLTAPEPRQEIPTGGVKFLGAWNYDTTLATRGPALDVIEMDAANSAFPEWSYPGHQSDYMNQYPQMSDRHTENLFEHVMHDPREPRIFYLLGLDDDVTSFGSSTLMAVGDSVAAFSSDGTNFTALTVPAEIWHDVAFIPSLNRWVAVGNTRNVIYSDDNGQNWTTVTNAFTLGAATSEHWNCVEWVPWLGVLIAGFSYSNTTAVTNGFAYSSDGISWTEFDTTTLSFGNHGVVGIAVDDVNDRVWIGSWNAAAYATTSITGWTAFADPVLTGTFVEANMDDGFTRGASALGAVALFGLHGGSNLLRGKLRVTTNTGSGWASQDVIGNNGDIKGVTYHAATSEFFYVGDSRTSPAEAKAGKANSIGTVFADVTMPDLTVDYTSCHYAPGFGRTYITTDNNTPSTAILWTANLSTMNYLTMPVSYPSNTDWRSVKESIGAIGAAILVRFSKLPPAMVSLTETYGLDDEYVNAAVEYVTVRALAKDGRMQSMKRTVVDTLDKLLRDFVRYIRSWQPAKK